MAECKHGWTPEGAICRDCREADLRQQLQQAQATIAAMRGAIQNLQKYVEFNSYSFVGISIKPDGVNYNSRSALAAKSLLNLYKTIESDTAGAELLKKIVRLEQENQALRCCGNCQYGNWCGDMDCETWVKGRRQRERINGDFY